MSSALVSEWERQNSTRWQRVMEIVRARTSRPVIQGLLVLAGFILGIQAASWPGSPFLSGAVRAALDTSQTHAQSATNELELVRLELARLQRITERSARHNIPADLSAAIYDIALAENIDPAIAYRLVHVESRFESDAISHAGAIGLTQVMPATAFGMNPRLTYADLFNRETNLHLGFSYLKLMLRRYDGDVRLALLAYNRGPGTVDGVLDRGGDPANGYARAVLFGR